MSPDIGVAGKKAGGMKIALVGFQATIVSQRGARCDVTGFVVDGGQSYCATLTVRGQVLEIADAFRGQVAVRGVTARRPDKSASGQVFRRIIVNMDDVLSLYPGWEQDLIAGSH